MIFAISCKTKEQTKEVLKDLNKLGYKWYTTKKNLSIKHSGSMIFTLEAKGKVDIRFNTIEKTAGQGEANASVLEEWENETRINKVEEAESIEQLAKLKQ